MYLYLKPKNIPGNLVIDGKTGRKLSGEDMIKMFEDAFPIPLKP